MMHRIHCDDSWGTDPVCPTCGSTIDYCYVADIDETGECIVYAHKCMHILWFGLEKDMVEGVAQSLRAAQAQHVGK